MIHELKIKPEYFAAVVSGDKTFEIRNNADRNFQVGDTLLLWEWDEGFTSQTAERTVSYITDFEQKPGDVVLGMASKRERELAEQLADATRQCGVMAELLREAIGEVPQTQSFPSRCDAALAGKLPEQHKTNWPDKCPITRRDFFMEIDGVPTYGGPFDSYTIPEMLGTPEQPWHERELFVRRFDHDEGRWVDDEVISQRVIHDGVLDELLDLKEQQADQSGMAPQGGEPCALEPRSSSPA